MNLAHDLPSGRVTHQLSLHSQCAQLGYDSKYLPFYKIICQYFPFKIVMKNSLIDLKMNFDKAGLEMPIHLN